MNSKWEDIVKQRLQLYGHRNWLVVADAAYPAQSKPGIETIVTAKELTAVLARVFAILRACKHIRPTIWIDEELRSITEKDASGVTLHRKRLGGLLAGYSVCALRHEEIISRIDRVGEKFRVLLLKTNTRIPYTSVFFELACGYWNADAEARLRAIMPFRNRPNGDEDEGLPVLESLTSEQYSEAPKGSKIRLKTGAKSRRRRPLSDEKVGA
jgi:hypothetical protein